MIKAVIFDIDGVLLDSKKANDRFFIDLIETAGYKTPTQSQLDQIFYKAMKQSIALLINSQSTKEIERIFKLGQTHPYPSHLATITKYAQPVVKKLASKYKLGIVTSRVNRGVSIFFELFGHRSLFDSVVGFEDYKRPKPDPEPIETSLKQLQVKPLEAVYIGDGPSDLKSAKAAGVYFIGYGEKVGNTKHKTSSLKELESVIKSLK